MADPFMLERPHPHLALGPPLRRPPGPAGGAPHRPAPPPAARPRRFPPGRRSPVIRAVLFDLDDTLYDQRAWLAGAWQAVAAAATAFGVAPAELAAALAQIAAEGSDRGRIIDRALERVGWAGVPVEPLVQAFRSHAPERLPAYPGVPAALARLRA